MSNWLRALTSLAASETPAVLVTVAACEGSTPREAGARMVFTADAQFDTIGGGHLEWCAAEIARSMLSTVEHAVASPPKLQKIALGPSLGQCCGGVMYLVFERIDGAAYRQIIDIEQRWHKGLNTWRAVALDSAAPMQLLDDAGRALASREAFPLALHPCATGLHRDRYGQRWLLDLCGAQRPRVIVFGAGHVGHALIRVLGSLACRVTWVDERDALFPQDLPDNVETEATDTPEAIVQQAAAGSYFIVMTHSHALDQRLAEQILRRGDAGWFGLIGSRSKRQHFEHRLRDRGLSAAQLQRMTCPIGIAGIADKQPASIAVAVAAQLLQLWGARK